MTAKSAEKKTISRGTYLQALALFTIADRRAQEARVFELELLALLGLGRDNDHLSDEIYNYGPGDFDDALARTGIGVAKMPKRKARAKR